MRRSFSLARKRGGLDAPAPSRAGEECGPAVMTWLAAVAGAALCAVAALLA